MLSLNNGLEVQEGRNTVIQTTDSERVRISNPKNTGKALDVGGGANFGASVDLNGNKLEEVSNVTFTGGKPVKFSENNVEIRQTSKHVAFSRSGIKDLLNVYESGRVEIKGGSLELGSVEGGGSLPTCDGDTEGAVDYNGTHHVGCNGNQWKALY